MRRGRVIHPFALAALVALVLQPSAVAAQARVIGPDQEAMVLGLFEPHRLGEEVSDGFALWGVSIEPTRVVVTLRSAADQRETSLIFADRRNGPAGAPRTASFAVAVGEGAADSQAVSARAALIEAVNRNDEGTFWSEATRAPAADGGSSFRVPFFSWGSAAWVPLDGITVIALVFLLALLLAGRLLIDQPLSMSAALAGIVVAGAVIRLFASPASFLGAWPWSRIYPNVRAVVAGEWIERIAEHAGGALYLTDVVMWTNYAYAVAMPLVLFSHATYLTRDARVGLLASAALAFLPQHIRFSRCEDGFVASLVLTSLAFALIHGFMRERSTWVRWSLFAALPFVLYPGYLLRPLNILFIVVYVAAILFLHEAKTPRLRRGLALASVLGVGTLASLEFFSAHAGPTVEALKDPSWLGWAPLTFLSPWHHVLIDPTRTPPLLILMAGLGAYWLVRSDQRRLGIFLVGWYLLFFVAHMVVAEVSMQPRYHLHLVVPFLILAAVAVTRLPAPWRPWRERALLLPAGRRGLVVVLGTLTILGAPLIHWGFVQDLDYAEMQEHRFVRRMRDVVPEGCTVVELSAGERIAELRFERIGDRVGSRAAPRFQSVGVLAERYRDGDPLEEILADPPDCLYLYEGLACTTMAEGDVTHSADCIALRERLEVTPVALGRGPGRFYDGSNAPLSGVLPDEVRFRLSRSNPRR